MDTGTIIILIIALIGILLVITISRYSSLKNYLKGSVGVEIILWLLFTIPGVFNSLWHSFSRNKKRN
jgi:hypothetical protein